MNEIAFKAEIDFHEQEVASIFHETNVSGRDESFAELAFAGAFCVRQMSNLGVNHVSDSIAEFLLAAASVLLASPSEFIDGGPEIIPYPGNSGRKRFVADWRLSARSAKLDFKAKGFGILARGMGYYALASVQILLRYLAGRRVDDPEYLKVLGEICVVCGQLQLERRIEPRNHGQILMFIMTSCLDAFLPSFLTSDVES